MPEQTESLADVQRQFMQQLYADNGAAPGGLIAGATALAAARVGVYRNNLRANFHRVLALEFPVIERLTGTDFFHALAAEFQREHASRSGNLHHIGEPFAAWLTRRFAATEYRWFGDVAALEWAWQEAYVAQDGESAADFSHIGELTAQQQACIRFAAHPACRIVLSRWPIVSIWEAHHSEAQTDARLAAIDMTQAENALILRPARQVRIQLVADAEAALLACLLAGRTLGEALDEALATDPQFDAATALRHAATNGVIVALRP